MAGLTPEQREALQARQNRTRTGETAVQPKQTAPQEDISAGEAALNFGKDALSATYGMGAGLVKGLGSFGAGTITMPYELPALFEAGYEYVTGDDIKVPYFDVMTGQMGVGDTELGSSYQKAATAAGATIDPNAPITERGLFYLGEGGPFVAKSILGAAIRGGQSVAGGFASEENAVAGAAISMVPTGRTGGLRGPKVTKRQVDQEAVESGRALTQATGVQETGGMQMYRKALELPDGSPEQLDAITKAKEVLVKEEIGRKDPTTALGQRNVSAWLMEDRKRSLAVENQMQAIAGSTVTNPRDAEEIASGVHKAFQKWESNRLNTLKTANRADFDKIPDDVYFDMSGVSSQFDAIVSKYDALEDIDAAVDVNNRAQQRRVLENYIGFLYDADGNQRDLTAKEIQATMAELNQIAYTGKGKGFDSLTPGPAKAMARELIFAFKSALDDPKLTEQQTKAAKTITDARANFKTRLENYETESRQSFVKFGLNGLDVTNDGRFLNELKAISNSPTQIKTVVSLVQKEDPLLWARTKSLVFEETFKSLRDDAGYIDFKKMREASRDLKKNQLLFNDKGQINQFDAFLSSLDGIMARYDRDVQGTVEMAQAYRVGKTVAEALGAASGPKGRYLGELANNIGVLLRKGKFEPEMASYLANNPEARKALTAALKGDVADISPKQIQALQMLAVIGKIRIAGATPSVYTGRSEIQSKSEEE